MLPSRVTRWLRRFTAFGLITVALGVLAACTPHGGLQPGSDATSASAGISSASADVQSALATLQADPGGQKVEKATNACPPMTGNQLTTVFLVDTGPMNKLQRGQVWVRRYELGKQLHASWPTFKTCVVNNLQMTAGQRSAFEQCAGARAFTFNLTSVEGAQSAWAAVQNWFLSAVLSCYDGAVGLKPSPASSGTGSNSPPSPSSSTSS